MPNRPRLTEEARKRLLDAVCARAARTVQLHAVRDQALADAFDLLARVEPPANATRWQNACDITDPLVLEQFMALFASVRTASSQRPFWTLRTSDSDDDARVQRFAQWVERVTERDGLDEALYNRDYVALRDGMAVLFGAWDSYPQTTMAKAYRLPNGEITFTPPDPELYDLAEVEELRAPKLTAERNGMRWQVLSKADFYTSPPNADGLEGCESAMHRLYVTATDLLQGVRDYDYDAAVVDRLLREGPTTAYPSNLKREAESDVAGVESDGYYELFYEVCRLPVHLDDKGEIAATVRNNKDFWFQFIHCPARQEVLRWGYYRYPSLPYVPAWLLRTPGTMDGESVPTIAGPFQQEATANVRLFYDAANLVMAPMFKVKQSAIADFGYPQTYPGAALPYALDPDEIQPLLWNTQGLQIGLSTVEHPLSRARQALSGESLIRMDDKVRKATEVQASMQGSASKFSLFLDNLQRSMVGVLRLVVMFYEENGALPAEFAGLVEGDLDITVRANSQNANPAVRLANVQTVISLMRQSPLYLQRLQQGDTRPEYHLLLEALSAVGWDNIRGVLGDEPPPPPPAPSPEELASLAMMGPGPEQIPGGQNQNGATRQNNVPAMAGGPPME